MDHDAPDMTTAAPSPLPHGARLAILGLGTVGTAVAGRLLDPAWSQAVGRRGHQAPRLVGIADLDLERERGIAIPDQVRQVTDFHELLEGDDVDIVIELMGGAGVAGEAVLAAFAAGKSVVTANKDLVARRGRELEEAAREARVSLRFEAAVLAGVPVLGPLVRELGASRVDSVRGIFNGTTNYILSTMAEAARDYADVLREAQVRGYAEADPSSDVEGLDAAYKLVLLSRLAWGGWADIGTVRRTLPAIGEDRAPGICGVHRNHLAAAARLGMSIKLVARAERLPDGSIRGGVSPMAVAAGSADRLHCRRHQHRRVQRGPGRACGHERPRCRRARDLVRPSWLTCWPFRPAPVPPGRSCQPAADLRIEDDLVGEQGWLVVVEGLDSSSLPAVITSLALATTTDGFITRP